MKISTDEYILYQRGFIKINYTLLFSWIVMLLLLAAALLLRRFLKKQRVNDGKISAIQAIAEIAMDLMDGQLKKFVGSGVATVFPFVATLFLYILVSNLLSLIPFCQSPTASLSTTAALALSTFAFAIGVGMRERGFGYFKKYFKPVFIMLPMNIIGDISKVISMAVRLYGNMVSSGVILLILTGIRFLSVGFPVLINLLGTISGVIQAYIFSMLAMIMISSGD